MILYREGPFFEDDEELCDTYREIIPTFDPAVWGVVGVEFDDIAACRHLLMILADDPRLIVDCDNGYVARGDAFLARCRREPHWDWRQEDG